MVSVLETRSTQACQLCCKAEHCTISHIEGHSTEPIPCAAGDGDRREFAKQQWADFVAANGVPERKRGAVTAAAPAEQGPKEQPAADNNQ